MQASAGTSPRPSFITRANNPGPVYEAVRKGLSVKDLYEACRRGNSEDTLDLINLASRELIKAGKHSEADQIKIHALKAGVNVNSSDLKGIVKKNIRSENLISAHEVIKLVQDKGIMYEGLDHDIESLISGFNHAGNPKSSSTVIRESLAKGVIVRRELYFNTVNSLRRQAEESDKGRFGNLERALDLLKSGIGKYDLNGLDFESLAVSCSKVGLYNLTANVLICAVDNGFPVKLATVKHDIKKIGELDKTKMEELLRAYALKEKNPNEHTIDLLIEEGQFDIALDYLNRMLDLDVPVLNGGLQRIVIYFRDKDLLKSSDLLLKALNKKQRVKLTTVLSSVVSLNETKEPSKLLKAKELLVSVINSDYADELTPQNVEYNIGNLFDAGLKDDSQELFSLTLEKLSRDRKKPLDIAFLKSYFGRLIESVSGISASEQYEKVNEIQPLNDIGLVTSIAIVLEKENPRKALGFVANCLKGGINFEKSFLVKHIHNLALALSKD